MKNIVDSAAITHSEEGLSILLQIMRYIESLRASVIYILHILASRTLCIIHKEQSSFHL